MGAADWESTLQRPATAAGGVPTRCGDVTVGPEGTKITLGDTTVTVVPTPGHTPGTLSYVFPVKDQGKTVMVAYSGGTLTGAFGTDGARWDEYIASQKKIAGVAAEVGAAVLLSNHSEYDGAYTKARLVPLKREPGEDAPVPRRHRRRAALFHRDGGMCAGVEAAPGREVTPSRRP